ncbi:MAG: TetR/AcrR family transcriptional regulator [Sideroxydans sp.]|nr:TetR/AcrR family transcriptional regulator [Sideroxydans sp.]
MNTSAIEPRQRRKEARPAELLSAALDLFVERGYAATKLDDIAIKARVSKGTLYLYFDSKEALFKAVIEQGILPMLAEGELLLQQHQGDARSLMQELMLRWWQLMGETHLGGIPKLMISEAGNFPEVATYYYENVILRGRELIRQALNRGVASGEFRALNVESAIDVILAPVLMLVVWRYSLTPCGCGTQDTQAYMSTYLDILMNGLTQKGSE